MTVLLDFRMNEKGDATKPLVGIKIPSICCNIVTSISYNFHSFFWVSDALVTFCPVHMSSPKDVWDNFVINKIHIPPELPPLPLKCLRCNNINEYADHSYCQKDGSYLCKSCVSYLYWDCKIPEPEKKPEAITTSGEQPLFIDVLLG